MGTPVTLVAPNPTNGADAVLGTVANPIITGTSTPSTTSGMTSVIVNTAAIGDTTISTATASQTTRVHRLRLNVAGATTITIKNGAATLEVLKFPAAGFLILDYAARPYYVTTANTALVMSNSAAVQVDGIFEFIKSA